jgi:23S rRNA pseudouridine2605 synthase
MAKRNTSRGTGRRSAPPSRGDSPKKKFSGKSSGGPRKSSSGKSYGKSASGRPFDSDKRERPTSNRNFDSKRSEKSFDKEKRPYGKKQDFSSSNSDRPYRKFDSDESKRRPYKKDTRESPTSNRNFDSRRSEKSFDKEKRPYGKKQNFSSSNSDKPYRKFDSDESKRRPYKKFDKKDSGEKRPYKKDLTANGPSTSLRRENSYKKFDGPPEQPKRKSSTSFSDRKSTESFKKAEGTKRQVVDDVEAPVQTEKIRLNKFIANSGVCSRREADELIKMGVISVNGKTITELGYKVNPGDEVRHESKVLRAEKPVYILLNKPKGFLTTTSDPQERNTVMHLIGNHVKERIYPVGRLDRNTTGLLLLTNDGDLADKLMHPSYNAKKIYKVELDRPITKGDAQLILEGVQLEEGRAMVDDVAVISEDKRTVGIEIHIGWNRVVRRIFEALNYEVVKLDRSVYAGLDKKNLGRGEWRFLTKEELVRLKHLK